MLFKYFTGEPDRLPVDGMPRETRYRRVLPAGSMRYCEANVHCRSWPCTEPGTNFQKQHDRDLCGRVLPDHVYLVQYRHPLEALASYYEWTLAHHPCQLLEPGDTPANWDAFLNTRPRPDRPSPLSYWRGFIRKWVLTPVDRPRLLLDYARLVAEPHACLAEVLSFCCPGIDVDHGLVDATVQNLQVRRQRRLADFVHLGGEAGAAVAASVREELDQLGLAPAC